jgi:hypothetical protein
MARTTTQPAPMAVLPYKGPELPTEAKPKDAVAGRRGNPILAVLLHLVLIVLACSA